MGCCRCVRQTGFQVLAYSPLRWNDYYWISPLTEEYGKTCEQIVLQFLLTQGVIPIPSTTNEQHLRDKASSEFYIRERTVTEIKSFSFWTTVARGFEDTAAEKGYHVIFCNTDENPEKEANYINILLQRRVDGFITAPSTEDGHNLLLLKRNNIPCVLIDRKVSGYNTDVIRSDGKEGARLLTQHLITWDTIGLRC